MSHFDTMLERFIDECQEISDVYMETNFSNLEAPCIDVDPKGKKFTRVVRDRSVHCFVAKDDGANKALGAYKMGDVFKAAGWTGPARGVRGNIFDEHKGVGRMGPYGPDYNRG